MSDKSGSIQVRPGRPGDEPQLLQVDTAANSSAGREQLFARACGSDPGVRERALVVLSDEVMQGFLIYSQVLDEVSIHDIAVHVDSQRQGLARHLLAAALVQMKSQGALRCLLEVRASNAAARALYSCLGFQVDGVRQNYYPAVNGREGAVLMSLQL